MVYTFGRILLDLLLCTPPELEGLQSLDSILERCWISMLPLQTQLVNLRLCIGSSHSNSSFAMQNPNTVRTDILHIICIPDAGEDEM